MLILKMRHVKNIEKNTDRLDLLNCQFLFPTNESLVSASEESNGSSNLKALNFYYPHDNATRFIIRLIMPHTLS